MAFPGASIYDIDLDFISRNAKKVLEASNIGYLKAAKLWGSIFQAGGDKGAVSSVFTEFYVDHEPLEVLDRFKAHSQWCLGELLDGHEYLVLFPIQSV